MACQDIVVWEWRNSNGLWIKYEPFISNLIEKFYEADKNQTINLGRMDPVYYNNVVIDLSKMSQHKKNSGKLNSIKRSLYSGDSILAKGIEWQYEGDNHTWYSYDICTMLIIEKNKDKKDIDLSKTRCRLPYVIDYVRMVQTRKETQKVRNIQRVHWAAGNSYDSPNSVPHVTPSPLNHPSSPVPIGPISGRIQNDNDATQGSDDPLNIVYGFSQFEFNPPDTNDCPICLSELTEETDYAGGKKSTVLKLSKCSHLFHQACLLEYYKSSHKGKSIQCPVCKTIYGVTEGICPSGIMDYFTMKNSLPGYERHGTIVIIYTIKSGTQGPLHPNPGHSYQAHGFPRKCYLPDIAEGREVLKMLILAWYRRLTFTIGTSLTTGISDSVIWNEIHHKTDPSSNRNGHGFPDPTYLDNVKMELNLQGVTKEQAEKIDL